ncbi:MAG: hypothetical protein K9N23_09895 [Akkermansiaceae bacterium]|nr:hypothetical protein [Akkermansiaceae bacterium]MCF7731991.1 hypothetical protein [Akkermansiaceae bacterium]
MKKKLVIDLASLPEEGKAATGELDPAIYALPEGDAVPVGPLAYDLWVQRFGSELVMTGTLESCFEFTCVRGLHPFVQTIVLEKVAIAVGIGPHVEIDVTETLREEVLINFPGNPRCEDADEPIECKIDSRYFVVDKPGGLGSESPPRAEGADPWSVLDKIKDLKDQP